MDVVRPRSRWRKPALVFGLVALVAAATTLAFRSGPTAGEVVVPRASVHAEAVARKDFVFQVPVTGALVPDRVEWLSAPNAARVAKIVARPGTAVAADSVVVVLENPELELLALEAEQRAASAESLRVQLEARTETELRSQSAALVSLRADLGDANRHAVASTRLASEGLLGALDLRDAASKHEGLSARVAAEESKLGAIERGRKKQLEAQTSEVQHLREIAAFRKRQLASLEVRAKIDGVVQEVALESGQWVATGALLAKIAGPEKLRAEVRVAEASAKDVQKGARVRFENPVGLVGTVERVDPAVVAGAVKLVVSLTDVPKSARADQAVSGSVEVATVPGALVVSRPVGAHENGPSPVFVLSADGATATRVVPRMGRASPREIQVESGLREGDRVVVSDTTSYEAATVLRIR